MTGDRHAVSAGSCKLMYTADWGLLARVSFMAAAEGRVLKPWGDSGIR